MSAALYFATALGLLWAVDRWLSPIRRWAALVLLLLPLIFTGRALLIDGLYGPFDLPYEVAPLVYERAERGISGAWNGMISDLYTQIIPYRKAVHDALARGEWPLWNPYTLSGEPLAAEAQPAAYSPITLLALLLPVAKSFTYTATLWFFLAALGAYLFARELGCGDIAGLFAGAAFMAASGLVFFILWPLGQSWALLPFVLLAVRRLRVSPWLLLIVLTILLLTGHPESVLHIVFVGAVYAIFVLFGPRPAEAGPYTFLLNGMLAGVLALGICAIDLLPFMEASKQTEQYASRTRMYAGSKRSAPVHESMVILATDVLASMQQRASNVSRPSYSASAGSIVLALLVYALWRVRGRERWFFAALLLFSLLEHARTPLEDLVQRLPLFDIAVNDRFAFGGALCVVVLAALGVEQLIRERDALRFAICGLVTLIFVTAASLWVEHSGLVFPNREMWGDYRFFADVTMLGIAVIVVVLRPRIAGPALLACLLLQRAMQESRVYPTFDADVAYPPVPLFAPLQNVREPFRITGQSITLLPGTNAFYGLEDVRGYSPMTFWRYDLTYDMWCRRQPVFVNIVDDLTRPFLSLANVRYAITLTFMPVPPHWHVVSRYRGTMLLENEDVAPRAFVPRLVHLGAQAPLMEMSLADDLRNQAWIHLKEQAGDRANGPGTVRIARRKLGFDLDATMEHDGWIVVSEPAWRGWRAYIDGRRVQHQIADVTFLGIFVPAGRHNVRLVYWPESFVRGRAISAVTLAGIAAFVIVRRRRATRDTGPRSDRS